MTVFSHKLFLFCSYFPWNILTCKQQKLLLTLTILSNWEVANYFYYTHEQYKVIYPSGTSDYITKHGFGSAQVIVSIFLKKTFVIVVSIFCSRNFRSQSVLNLFLFFFTNKENSNIESCSKFGLSGKFDWVICVRQKNF